MKKQTSFWTFSVLFLFSIITFSCDTFKLEHFVDEETKSYCYFENGIQYVYLDSVSGNLDTLYLNDIWDITDKGTPSHPGQIISSSGYGVDNENSSMWISCEPMGDPFDNSTESYSWAYFRGVDWDFNCYYISRNYEFQTFCESSLELVEILTTYQLENTTYYDVKKVKSENTHQSEYSYSYWAKNVGLIKYERYKEDSILNNINLRSYEIPG